MAKDLSPVRRRLLERQARLLVALPPAAEVLRGSLFVRTLRCGTPTCRCAKGPGHRVTYVSVTHPSGKTEQLSLPAAVVPTVRRWTANYRSWKQGLEAISAVNRDLIRLDRQAAREAEKG